MESKSWSGNVQEVWASTDYMFVGSYHQWSAKQIQDYHYYEKMVEKFLRKQPKMRSWS